MTEKTDYARMISMIAPYRITTEEVAYDIKHNKYYDIIYFNTDDSYVHATMYFDKTGKFVGFFDPDFE